MELTKDKSLSYDSQKIIGLLQKNAKHLNRLVHQVLDFRKSDKGRLRVSIDSVVISDLLQDIFTVMEPWAHEKGIYMVLENDVSDIEGHTDSDKLEKIVYNLVSNAIKFTPAKGRIRIKVKSVEIEKKEWLRIQVSDTGPGIPVTERERIFERFYQIDQSTDGESGFGIGLSLVRTLVDALDGYIHMEEQPKTGACFILEIPLHKKEDEPRLFDNMNADIEAIKKEEIKYLGTGQKILVVEDNPDMRSYLLDALSEHYHVLTAANGHEALDVCENELPILCLVDVMMPIMDGFTFCEKLKQNVAISHIPVMLLTALDTDKDVIKGYKLGADGYMGKPFAMDVLRARIENLIASRQALRKAFAEDMSVDTAIYTHSPADRDFLETMVNLIQEHLDDSDLGPRKICEILGLAQSTLYRKVKDITDMAPIEFIRNIRLKRAYALLGSKKYNVSEVATMVGFNDPLYFSRCFKAQFGVPPSQLVKNK